MSFDLRIRNNDLSINPDGTLQTVRDNSKLGQDITKIILTPLGSNQFFRWYGSIVGARVIGETLSESQVEIEIQRAVQDALSNLMSIQQVQAREQYVSSGEMIASIEGISVLRNPEDPRLFEIAVFVLTRALTVVEETFILQV